MKLSTAQQKVIDLLKQGGKIKRRTPYIPERYEIEVGGYSNNVTVAAKTIHSLIRIKVLNRNKTLNKLWS